MLELGLGMIVILIGSFLPLPRRLILIRLIIHHAATLTRVNLRIGNGTANAATADAATTGDNATGARDQACLEVFNCPPNARNAGDALSCHFGFFRFLISNLIKVYINLNKPFNFSFNNLISRNQGNFVSDVGYAAHRADELGMT